VPADSAGGDQGEWAGAGTPPVASWGIIGQVASLLLIKTDKKRLDKAKEIVKKEVIAFSNGVILFD
jgi:hypothetical protein